MIPVECCEFSIVVYYFAVGNSLRTCFDNLQTIKLLKALPSVAYKPNQIGHCSRSSAQSIVRCCCRSSGGAVNCVNLSGWEHQHKFNLVSCVYAMNFF